MAVPALAGAQLWSPRGSVPGRWDPGSVQGLPAPGQASPLSALISGAPLLGSLAGSPWDVGAVGAHGERVDPSGAETQSSAFLAFPGITEEKKIIFPTPTENAKSEVFLHKIASLLNPICLPPPQPTAPAAAGEIQGTVIKHCS